MDEPSPRRPFTEAEVEMVRALARCCFLPGSHAKRFARHMVDLLEDGMPPTDLQAQHLRRLVIRLRRQIPERIVATARAEDPDAAMADDGSEGR